MPDFDDIAARGQVRWREAKRIIVTQRWPGTAGALLAPAAASPVPRAAPRRLGVPAGAVAEAVSGVPRLRLTDAPSAFPSLLTQLRRASRRTGPDPSGRSLLRGRSEGPLVYQARRLPTLPLRPPPTTPRATSPVSSARSVSFPRRRRQDRSPTDFICGQEDENDRAEVVLVCEPDLHNNLMGALHPNGALYEVQNHPARRQQPFHSHSPQFTPPAPILTPHPPRPAAPRERPRVVPPARGVPQGAPAERRQVPHRPRHPPLRHRRGSAHAPLTSFARRRAAAHASCSHPQAASAPHPSPPPTPTPPRPPPSSHPSVAPPSLPSPPPLRLQPPRPHGARGLRRLAPLVRPRQAGRRGPPAHPRGRVLHRRAL